MVVLLIFGLMKKCVSSNLHMRVMNEERLWLSEYNRLADGTVPLKDHDNGKPIPHTAVC